MKPCPAYPPLFPVVLAMAAGILAARAWPGIGAGLVVPGLIAFFLFVCIWGQSTDRRVIVLCCLAGVWSVVTTASALNPRPAHISCFATATRYELTGTIVAFASHPKGRIRTILSCERLGSGTSSSFAVKGKVLLNIYAREKTLVSNRFRYGDRIRLNSPIRAIRNFANPHGYDYETRMHLKGIFGSVYANADQIQILSQPGEMVWYLVLLRKLETLRNYWYFKILNHEQDRDSRTAAAILAALATGKKEGILPDVRDWFSQAGVSHLLAISGLHLSIIALIFYRVFYGVLGRIPCLTVSGAARKAAGILTLIPLLAYAVFAGFSPSTQRALIMTALFMAAILGEQEPDPLNTLCLAAIIILALDASALFSISFQLSFSALGGIFMGFALIRQPRGRNKVQKQMPAKWKAKAIKAVTSGFLVSVFAGLGTFPLTAVYFNTVSYIQPFSNLILVPLVGFVCLPLGLAAVLISLFCETLSNLCIDLGIQGTELALGITRLLAGGGPGWSRVVTPDLFQVGLIYLFLGAVWLWIRHPRNNRGPVVLALVAAAAMISVAYDVKKRFYPGQLRVTILDVGQGSAALIHTSGGHTVLMDGGGFSSISGFDPGRFLVGPFLWAEKIKTLDAVILSHPESDHMNGLVFILKNFRVKQWIQDQDRPDHPAFQELVHLAREKKINRWKPGPSNFILDLGDTRFCFLHREKDWGSRNSNSLVCQVRYQGFSILFPGDIEHDRETGILQKRLQQLSSTVLVAPHHGSPGSSGIFFLDQIKPESVLVSCGYQNRYGFPRPSTLKRFARKGIRVFRTDLHGAVTLTVEKGEYQIITQR